MEAVGLALLSCRHVCFAYESSHVCENIDFEINEGDYLCIVGENGAGKSTLIKGLLGLKAPCSGKIIRSPELRGNEIGYLPQQTSTQSDFPAGVFEVVLSGCLNSLGPRPFYRKKDRDKALSSLEKLGILNLKDCCYRELSGGQQQRVLLARALCSTKKLLLLDEPFAGLDPLVTADLYSLIEHINRDMGISVIMVSHDIKGVVKYASHILHLKTVQIFFGKTEDYLKSDIGSRFLGGQADD
jgi:zinc transport system ATP-binding protein